MMQAMVAEPEIVYLIAFVGARLYQMVVVTVAPGGTADRPDTRRFLDSFSLETPALKERRFDLVRRANRRAREDCRSVRRLR